MSSKSKTPAGKTSKPPSKPLASKPTSKPKEEPKKVEEVEEVENSEPDQESEPESEPEPDPEDSKKPKRVDDPPPKPMSEEDVLEVMSKLSSLDAKEINAICDGYTQKIKGLVTYVKKSLSPKTDEDELVEVDRIMRLINMCPKDELFIRSKDKIWHARYHILDRDSSWFLNRNYSASIKKDHKQRMIETLIRMIQGKWKKMSDEEQELYWEKAFELLNLVARFKKLTNEH
jgi:DNA mismatch repair ATPase MutL